jgi:putative SOS response-associated peptidase YedK
VHRERPLTAIAWKSLGTVYGSLRLAHEWPHDSARAALRFRKRFFSYGNSRCVNNYRLLADAATLVEGFSETRIKIRFSEGKPNLEAREDIRITDTAAIVRTIEGELEAGDLVQRRWSWPEQNRKPVYNFRSEGREFASGRCLIPADGFYEFTDPADKKKKRKDKWLFTKTGDPWFCIAGIWRAHKGIGEAFTMLTMPPGPDIAPYHDRQIVILDHADWAAWLDPTVSAKTILKPLAAGTLAIEHVG